MPLRLDSVVWDAVDPARIAGFWAALLGRRVIADAGGRSVPGEGTQLGLRFVATDRPKVSTNRAHLHLTSADEGQMRRTIETVLALGGRHVDVGQPPDAVHVVLGDPEGNEFCVIPPGNDYLAGTGYLGELACDGSRTVGLFWRDALGWPLVWERGDETAIQLPAGGTKVSWGGEPRPTEPAGNRFRLEIAADGELSTALEWLLSLGATRPGVDRPPADGPAVLADPDGNEFWLSNR